MPPSLFGDKKIDTAKYKDIFEEQGLKMNDTEIETIIENIDNIGNLFFDKYLQSIEKNDY